METSNWIQLWILIVLTCTLVVVLWYACETRKQAKASVELGKEAARSRRAQSRPVLDIRKSPIEDFGSSHEALVDALRERWNDDHVWCWIVNVGKGPALDMTVIVVSEGGNRDREQLGTLAVVQDGLRRPIAIEEGYVQVSYRDIYGMEFYSRRAVESDELGPHLGLLETDEC